MSNDRFKFRVWDNITKKYLQDEEFCINCLGALVIQSEFDGDSLRDMDDFIIEQCTGLKDKNGKLIYEGDRVESHDMFDDLEIFNVEWFQGKMVLRSTPNSAPVLVWNSLSFEIIGNIHAKERKDEN